MSWNVDFDWGDGHPPDAFTFMDEVSRFARIFVWTLAGALLIGFVSSWHLASEITEEAIEKESRIKRVMATPVEPERVLLTAPIACDAWIAQRGANEPWRVRCVSR